MVSDPLALQYIINSPNFERGPVTDNLGAILFGDKSVIIVKGMFPFPLLDGTSVLMLVVALGNEHRRLRSALNPAFTAAAVRNYQPVFKKVAEMVRMLGHLFCSCFNVSLCRLRNSLKPPLRR
jgi:cytochrome P450